MAHVGEKIKESRIQKGMSQDALAAKSGVSERTIQRIEGGKNQPTGDTLNRISSALDMELNQLIDLNSKSADKSNVILIHLASFTFLIFPFFGFLIPWLINLTKKESNVDVNDLINFEITWNLILFLIPGVLILLVYTEALTSISFRNLILIVALMYLINFTILLLNTIRINSGRRAVYFTLARFLK